MIEDDKYRQRIIDSDFGGDAEKYEQSIIQENRYVVSWRELTETAEVHPEMSKYAHAAIRVMLGYLPHQECLLKFEPAIRAVAYLAKMGSIEDNGALYATLEDHIKPIRNADMVPIAYRHLDEKKLKYYYDTFHPYGQIIRDRLTYLLGNEPRLEQSLDVELNMREHIKSDLNAFSGKVAAADMKALVAIRYKEILLNEGLDAANNSPLIGRFLRASFEREEAEKNI
ncbi:hypothetical protein [Mucilaginibacter pedocola]|uniref:Uncharacterized protein n=1 Tax=Mucilaginibacter pedocola TaxID=1792845 RepID=A0A1S9P8W4_9SPHI|nr:hypothetical protein [Mucilaginibacter pedocola]OOQ57385.1 hypothetical protein BC343_14890 [Mucilaginibacter pedocola]